MKIIKHIPVFLIALFLSFLWTNTCQMQSCNSFHSIVLPGGNGLEQQGSGHDCTWDGDDIVSANQDIDMPPVIIKTVYLALLSQKPSLHTCSIWQPPEFS